MPTSGSTELEAGSSKRTVQGGRRAASPDRSAPLSDAESRLADRSGRLLTVHVILRCVPPIPRPTTVNAVPSADGEVPHAFPRCRLPCPGSPGVPDDPERRGPGPDVFGRRAQVLNLTPSECRPSRGRRHPTGRQDRRRRVSADVTLRRIPIGVLIRLNADGSLDDDVRRGRDRPYLTSPVTTVRVPRGRAPGRRQDRCHRGHGRRGGPSLVARFHADGSLDTTFGTDGVAWTGYHSVRSRHPSGRQGRDRRVALRRRIDVDVSFAVVRFNADGTLDETFGVNGMMLAVTGGRCGRSDVLVQPDGKILLGGTTRSRVRGRSSSSGLNPDGSFDTTFDGDGVVTTASGFVEQNAGIRGLALAPDGKIVATGVAQDWAHHGRAASSGTTRTGVSTRPSTGTARSYTTVPGARLRFAGEDVAVQADGKIVVTGGVGFRATGGRLSPGTTPTARSTRRSPPPRACWHRVSSRPTSFPTTTTDTSGWSIQADGKIVAVGQAGGGT